MTKNCTDTQVIERPVVVEDEHLIYLDNLRESGDTNMFGAGLYLENAFGLNEDAARKVLTYWMRTFSQRHEARFS